MKKRGRKSREELSQVVLLPGVVPGERPEPPEHLTAAQGEIWRQFTGRMPSDWFQAESLAPAESAVSARDDFGGDRRGVGGNRPKVGHGRRGVQTAREASPDAFSGRSRNLDSDDETADHAAREVRPDEGLPGSPRRPAEAEAVGNRLTPCEPPTRGDENNPC